MPYHLLSWGANSHGQLGQGFQSEECTTPKEVDLSECSLHPKNIKKIVGGAGHTLVLDNAGSIYSCGWNNKGQAGFSNDEGTLLFRKVGGDLENKVVLDIACGWDSSAALTSEGILYAWGSNNYGQLGKQPNVLRWSHEPFSPCPNRKIERVSMGLRHTALITDNGSVITAGSGNKGQLGVDSSSQKNSFDPTSAFREVPTINNAMDVACGQHHTVVATTHGELYVFGDNKHGQLGLDPQIVPRTVKPTKLTNIRLQADFKIYTGWSHTIVLNNGAIFSWGRNTYGQLGCLPNERLSSWQISRMNRVPKIQQIATGSEHAIALTEDASIFCWGWNEHGNCGIGHTRDVFLPEELSLRNSAGTLIGIGAGHSFAVIKVPDL